MEVLVRGRVLLVGEGDFSFTLSLVKKLPGDRYSSMLATSLETEDSIQKHQNAAFNIQELQKHGVMVQLRMDATQLHTDRRIEGKMFDCVIFNFPHAGGKSNHKKNRNLLNDFFASAVQVLETKGQILMTLCKGQGGTPADQPIRAWHDSWQVVSMAANSSLILVAVIPFRAEDYSVYTSTGFRSLDKGFHTDSALTHVFETAQPVEIPTSVDDVRVRLGDKVYLCPGYLYRKLQQIQNIRRNVDHPVNKLYQLIVQQMETVIPDLHFEDLGMFPPIRRSLRMNDVDSSEIESPITTCESSLCTDEISKHFYKLTRDCSNSDTDIVNDLEDLFSGSEDSLIGEKFDMILISDPLQSCQTDMAHITLQLSYTPVFKQTVIAPQNAVVAYHMIINWPVRVSNVSDEECKMSGEWLMKQVQYVISLLECKIFSMFIGKTEFKLLVDFNLLYQHSTDTCNSHICNVVDIMQMEFCSGNGSSNAELASVENHVGGIYVQRTQSCGIYIIVTLNMSKLSCIQHRIEDPRLLWSEDYRVLGQFSNPSLCLPDCQQKAENNMDSGVHQKTGRALSCGMCSAVSATRKNENCNDIDISKTLISGGVFEKSDIQGDECYRSGCNCNASVIKSPSLYPITFIHDMSFWENKTIRFDELEFCEIIQNIANDNVKKVELKDTYTEAVSGNVSRCYRLTFQSVDKALSYNTSWKLQSLLRLQVEKEMKITLR